VSDGVIIALRVTPRGGRDAIEGVDEAGALRVRVAAPPADGAANKAVTKLLAKALGVPRSGVSISAGAGARHKRLRVEGLDAAAVLARWPGVGVSEG
jgi:uncharacterized protein (TIGR00251 family)